MLGAVLYKGWTDVIQGELPEGWSGPFLVGTLAAAGSGLIAIEALLGYVRRHNYSIFVVYRLIAAAIILLLAFGSVRAMGLPIVVGVAGAAAHRINVDGKAGRSGAKMIEAVGGERRDAALARAEAADQRQTPRLRGRLGFGGRGRDIFFGKLEEKPVFAVVLHRRSFSYVHVRLLARVPRAAGWSRKSDLHLVLPTRTDGASCPPRVASSSKFIQG